MAAQPTIDRETLVLRSYFLDHPAMRRFRGILRPEQFEIEGGNMLFSVLRHYFQEYGRMPSPEEAVLEVRDYRGPKQTDETAALALLDRFATEKDASPEPRWLRRQPPTHRRCRNRPRRAGLRERRQPYQGRRRGDRQRRPVTSRLQGLRHPRDADAASAGRVGLRRCPLRLDKFNSPQQRFTVGLPAIDELTNGGLARGQVGVVAAGSGVGKSMMLCHLAAEAARKGAGVLYINCESEDYELQARIISNLANIRNDQYRALDLEGLKRVHERCAQYRVIVRDLLTSARPADLSTAVEEFRFKYGQHPDVIIVDYLNELEPAKESKTDTSYSSVARNLKDLMKLAKRAKSALWTAVQFNREGLKKSKKGSTEKPDATHIAESISVLFKATLVLTMSLLDDENQDHDIGFLNLTTEKYRFNSGASGIGDPARLSTRASQRTSE